MGARILVVEDEMDLAELVSFNLREAGHQVTIANNGSTALVEIRRMKPDLVILDLMLHDISGLEICRRIRRDEETARIPVLMLTAKGTEVDRVVGFEVGADDYVVKPFSPRELTLRVEAILRRAHGGAEAEAERQIIQNGRLTIDIPAHRVTVDEVEVPLTALEFRLLLDLATRMGRVQSRDALLERVWGYAPGVETRTVDTHVKRLREKLGEGADCIETVRGVGYRLRDLP
ncbi:MAG: response regulator [Sandaracinaceae bacterium]|nr:response regulator [Sandaracinaceae bacterium]